MAGVFAVKNLSKYLSLLVISMKCYLDARCSLTVNDVQRETHVATFIELCSVNLHIRPKKCVSFAITNGLYKNWPRKCRPTDRSTNRTWTF